VLAGCLLFGFADAFSLRLQTLGYPSYLILAVPYLVALSALFALSYRARPKLIRETAETMRRFLRTDADPPPSPRPPEGTK
jgi:simple sugar transport system permease protein